jgi:hypothetical protein
MRQVKLLVGALVMGGLVGGLAVWQGPRPGSGARDPLLAGTRRICEAMLQGDEPGWKEVQHRYFARAQQGRGSAARREAELFRAARAQSLFFPTGSRILRVRRSADGHAGTRHLVAVECLVTSRRGERAITVHWSREKGERWRISDVRSAAATAAATDEPGLTPSEIDEPDDAPESPAKAMPAARKAPVEGGAKPHPQGY